MEGLEIQKHIGGHELPMNLLLLADPSSRMIKTYIHGCDVFIAKFKEEVIACFALFPHDSILIEIKNIAVKESFQGKGVGTLLLNDAIVKARQLGYQKIRICTGNSSLGQLYLYKKLGFNETEVIAGFFRDNYPEPIFENGMECLDLIVLEKEL
jgi:N-acetylglutamate synthase-like GNAT family acetyltransferase